MSAPAKAVVEYGESGKKAVFRMCRSCKALKPHVTHKEAMEKGLWYGTLCPACHVAELRRIRRRAQENARKKLLRDEERKLDYTLKAAQPERFCRKCKKKLPSSRYYYHAGCEPAAFSTGDGDWMGGATVYSESWDGGVSITDFDVFI